MKYIILLLTFIALFSCSKKDVKPISDKSVARPVKTLKSKGKIILYQDGRHEILSFNLIKDEENSILSIKTRFNFDAVKVYVKSDSVWVFIPHEKVAYFQDKSNVLLIPMLQANDIPIGMLMDYLAANFSFKYSIIYDQSDLDLIESLRKIKYGYINGELARVEYDYGKSVMNTAISNVGQNIKLNLKRNDNLFMTVNIENIVLQAQMPDSIFVPKIPSNYQFVKL